MSEVSMLLCFVINPFASCYLYLPPFERKNT